MLCLLFYSLSQLLEMFEQLFVVHSLMDVEPVPKVAAYHHASESKLFGYMDIVEIDASQGIHVSVDESLFLRLLQLLIGSSSRI